MLASRWLRGSEQGAQLGRVLRDMNSVLSMAEDWEERVGCVLADLGSLVPVDLAAVLLADSQSCFLAYLHSTVRPELVETVKANVVEHYRLLSERQVEAEAFPTTFLGPLTPADTLPSDPSGGGDTFRQGSYLSLPMLAVDEVVGVVHVFSLEPDNYAEEELVLFSLVASKLGSYLSHVQQHKAMELYEQERDNFMAEVLHELKNPLTSANGFTQILLRQLSAPGEADKAKIVEVLEHIYQQQRRVVQMADSVVDAARTRAGWMSLERERVDLGELAERVAENLRATTDKHEITVEVVGDCVVWGDRGRLEQVLRNLVSNAVKFSPDGGLVEIRLERQDVRGQVAVAVRDTGVGIPGEQLAHLFERYYRADTGTRGRIGGSGLGLYISNEIIRRHGGRILVSSEPGKGSTFSFALPTVLG